MIVLFSFILILNGMYLLHLLSRKQLEKRRKSRWVWLITYKLFFKMFGVICLLIAGLILMHLYGSSIGFVSWWIFATPLVFMLILSINDLKSKSVNKRVK